MQQSNTILLNSPYAGLEIAAHRSPMWLKFGCWWLHFKTWSPFGESSSVLVRLYFVRDLKHTDFAVGQFAPFTMLDFNVFSRSSYTSL